MSAFADKTKIDNCIEKKKQVQKAIYRLILVNTSKEKRAILQGFFSCSKKKLVELKL